MPLHTFDSLNDLAAHIHAENVRAGWWDGHAPNEPEFAAVKIALIHSEVSELLEGVRKGHNDEHLPHRRSEEVEAADLLIRLLDLAGAREWDLDGAVADKRAYNRHRLDHSRTAREAVGGKKF